MNKLEEYRGGVVLVAFYDIDSFPVCTLHSVLKRDGHKVVSLFFKRLNSTNTMTFPTRSEMDCFVDAVKDLRPLFVGMSVRSTHFKLAAELSRRIREEAGIKVLWGGTHASIRPEQSLQHADMVCVGEGEGAVAELASRLSRGQTIDDTRNLWIRKDGGVVKNEMRSLIADLDQVPFPDFTDHDKFLLEDGQIRAYPSPAQKKAYWIMTSRGCPYSCAYCCNNVLQKAYKNKGAYVRRRSVGNVLAELAEAKKLFPQVSFVAFEDDVFTMNLNWLKDFAAKYKELIRLPFFCYCYPSSVTEPLLLVLKDAGVTEMTMGIQTGSPSIRSGVYGRRESNADILAAARLLNRHGIHCSYDIILDSLIESEADRKMTFDLVSSLPRPFGLHTHTLTHFPETDLTKMLLEKNLITEEDVEDQKQESYQRWTPQLDLKRAKADLHWDNLYYLLGNTSISTETIVAISRNGLVKKYPRLVARFLIVARVFGEGLDLVLRIPRGVVRRLRRMMARA